MKYSTASAVIFAASIALAIAAPARGRYYIDDEEDSGEKIMLAPRAPYNLATAPFYYQPRNLGLEELPVRQRKYQIVKKKKKNPNAPAGSDEEEEEPQDEEDDESSEEEQDEEGDEDEEDDLETPGWDKLFPEEDKNTGMFDDQGGSGIGGGPQADAHLPGGAPAPPTSGSIMSLFGGGSSGSNEGPQSDYSGGPPRGQPPQRPSFRNRGRSSLLEDNEEEPRSGGAVLFDGYRYIPVNPVQVRIPQRISKKVKNIKKQSEVAQARSLPPTSSSTSSRQHKVSNRPRYVLVPVQQRNNREIRFVRENEGYKVESGPIFSPTEIWRWEGPGGRPLRRRDSRPSKLYYRPHREHGTPFVRFNAENDY